MQCCQFVGVVLLLLGQILLSHEDSEHQELCPISFQLSYTKSRGRAICYKLKEPEAFEDFYKDCVGNKFSVKLYHDLNISSSKQVWTEYRSFYPGGPFIDTSYTDKYGDKPEMANLNINRNISLDEEWCIVLDPDTDLAVVKCSEKHYRYCFVEPYPYEDDMSNEGCEDLTGSIRFRSPISTCVAALEGRGGSSVRATWSQARGLCANRSSSLLYTGWIYANSLKFVDKILPLGLKMSADSLRYDALNDRSVVPQSKWNFANTNKSMYEEVFGAQNKVDWYLVNSTYVFYNVVCERAMPLKYLDMRLTINYDENLLELKVNDTIDRNDIACYTDSIKENPEKVSKSTEKYSYELSKNGYYWCLHKDVMNFVPSESNKVLYIKTQKERRSYTTPISSIYAIKIYLNEPYTSKNLSSILKKIWTTKIEKYIYYKYRYQLEHGRLNSTLAETDLRDFVENNITDDDHMESVSFDVKRSYLDFRTVLVHATLDSKFDQYMGFMSPGSWQGVQVLSVKPAYYCKGILYNIHDTRLGGSVNASNCRTYHCVGDYIEGVDFLLKRTEGCVSNTTITTTTRADIQRDVQLQQVMHELDRLVNKSDVSVGDLEDVFDQVDNVLMEHDDDLEIPGQLLHLLDQLGSTVVLNETGQGQAVRPNIALLMADAQPDNPVRGFRISIINDTFQDQDFEFISEEPNSTIMSTSESEVVVHLPSSVSNVQRRVSFVVFRNDRAFNSHGYAVNSRVLSVNIENVTHFHGEEFIDIHLNPIVTELARNESRSCAYWHFLDNDTNSGYWSQEGCTLIRATEDGMLDTCRCNHLTHFAEILAPKAVFSEADENALEIITLVGCILSMVGLIMIGITALLFRSWRREYSNKIWLQLCMAIFILVLSFFLVIFVHFDQYDVACLLVGILLHYAVLASFCWMLVAAVLAYRRLVLVFSRDTPHKLLKAAAFSWGAPCVVVGVLLSVSRQSYRRTFEEKTPSGAFCYPTGLGFWLTVYAPLTAILLTNWILFALIVRSVFVSRRIQRHGESNEALRCVSVSCMLVFLFGLPWIFGIFASNVVAAYLFTLTATFQGFILFIFFVIGNKKTRDLWLNMLHIKQTRKVPVTSSTYTNRSAEWRAVNAPTTLEAKVSKPKVLASKDESRFS